MSVRFVPDQVVTEFNDDSEFRLCARYWSGVLEFGVGDRSYAITMTDGVVASVEEQRFDPDGDAAAEADGSVRIYAPESDWELFVQDPAPPFYLDYYGASAHHGFKLAGNADSLWAYYPAIRRTADLFRRIAITEGA